MRDELSEQARRMTRTDLPDAKHREESCESIAEIRDLRDWLSAVDGMGELQVVRGVDWNLEIGGISQINYRQRPNKALLFDDIKDYAAGYRVLTASMGSARRLALTFRLSTELDNRGLIEAMRGKPLQWENDAARFSPRHVNSGAVLDEVHEKEAVDVLEFPAPVWHEKDGGRYIGTGCVVVTRDPDSDWINLGAYRIMVLDERHVTVLMVPGKHGRMHYEKWWAREGRCPIAISLGHDPLLFALAGVEIPLGVGEYNYAGAVMGQPVDIVAGPKTGLPIPAGAEAVLEGWIYPDRQALEGPFGEWTGYYTQGGKKPSRVPVVEVETALHRKDPILLGAPPGKPPHDFSYMKSVMKSAMIQDALVRAGLRGIRGVWAPECGGGRSLIVVSLKQDFSGHSRQVAAIAGLCPEASYMNRYVVVVDEDIDYMNLEEVVWALCTRVDPATDIEVMRKTQGSPVDPLWRGGGTYNSRAFIDACKPFDWIDEFPEVAESSPEFMAGIAQKWSHVFSK